MMDLRNSKESMLKKIVELEGLEKKLTAVFDAGMNGIGYVGAANYECRQNEAIDDLNIAMWGEK